MSFFSVSVLVHVHPISLSLPLLLLFLTTTLLLFFGHYPNHVIQISISIFTFLTKLGKAPVKGPMYTHFFTDITDTSFGQNFKMYLEQKCPQLLDLYQLFILLESNNISDLSFLANVAQSISIPAKISCLLSKEIKVLQSALDDVKSKKPITPERLNSVCLSVFLLCFLCISNFGIFSKFGNQFLKALTDCRLDWS